MLCLRSFRNFKQKIFNNDESLIHLSVQIFSKALCMNKTELIEHIAKQADISKAAAGRALEATIGAVRTTLKKGGTVALVGFGTFAVTKRAARTGRNPRTGAAIKIKSAKVPKFRPGKALKDALN
jgi:DNA-binding protein HU-beta